MSETDYMKLNKMLNKTPIQNWFGVLLGCIKIIPNEEEKETKNITEKDIDNVCNAFSVLAKFKNKLEWGIEHYKKEINDGTQIVKSIEAQEDILKNNKTLGIEHKAYISSILKDYEKMKKMMKETILVEFEETLEFYNDINNILIKNFETIKIIV